MAGKIGIKCLMFQYTSILLVYGFTGDPVSTEIPIVLRSILDEYFAVLGTCIYVCLMVFNATFNNISVIS